MSPVAYRVSRLLVAAALVAAAAPAFAISQRAFVASGGSDANACSLAAPCRSFGQAIAMTATEGEVIVLDSAGYGPATITQSVTISSPPGVYAGISVASGDGVTVNGPGINVVLRGPTINGQGGSNGITVTTATSVRVEGCTISNFAAAGIQHVAGVLHVEDTTVRNNAGIGIWSVGPVQANLDRVRVDANLEGVRAQNGAQVVVHDSVMAHNVHAGAFAFDNAGALHTSLTVSRSVLSFNERGVQGQGIIAATFIRLTVSDSTISQNSVDGLSLSENNGANVLAFVRHNVIERSGNYDLHAIGKTGASIDDNQIGAMLIEAAGTLFTRDNNWVTFPGVLGALLHITPF